ncbi:zinc-dependent metalloprotease [Alphaentomopoxvirus acuprea]|uniref:Zinc-dependent metalloprotease n=1 Tax=Alphaentomopoxvirus acuprea TaxID=62099 RepID=W6JLQ8_9POXV|nr:zinc-dependent metalloprotease [Anomala cuprea entomopoxvirus]BAO49601.1 zinc-dependent metalloprotease [Anomala cuprea entomopoxvirus]
MYIVQPIYTSILCIINILLMIYIIKYHYLEEKYASIWTNNYWIPNIKHTSKINITVSIKKHAVSNNIYGSSHYLDFYAQYPRRGYSCVNYYTRYTKLHITYTITFSTYKLRDGTILNSNQIKSILHNAFNAWTKFSRIIIRYVRSYNADIIVNVMYKPYNKKDGYVLAHAYFPNNYIRQQLSVNLLVCCGNISEFKSVILHEIGHIFGFSHVSYAHESIMVPALIKHRYILPEYDVYCMLQSYGLK